MMKKLIILMSFLSVFVSPVIANATSIAWDPPDQGVVKGYTLYFGPTDGDHTQYHYSVDQNTTQIDMGVLNLIPGVNYTFTCRAWNEYGESEDSNSVDYTRSVYQPPANVLPSAEDAPTKANNLIQN